MTVADLHLHTTVSDGVLTLAELPAAAEAGGVEAVAVTDHDRYHPGLESPVQRIDGVTVIRGIELRADAGDQRVDLLGYGLEETPGLAAECDRIQRDRQSRGRRMVERVEAETGVELDVEIAPGLGRPDVARAVEASDAPYDYGGAFDELIGNGRPCYVARDVPSVETGRPVAPRGVCGRRTGTPVPVRRPRSGVGARRRLRSRRGRTVLPVRSRPGSRAVGGTDRRGGVATDGGE